MATYATMYRKTSTLEVEVRHRIGEIRTTREHLGKLGTELIMDQLTDVELEMLLQEHEAHCFDRYFDPGVEDIPAYSDLFAEQLSRS